MLTAFISPTELSNDERAQKAVILEQARQQLEAFYAERKQKIESNRRRDLSTKEQDSANNVDDSDFWRNITHLIDAEHTVEGVERMRELLDKLAKGDKLPPKSFGSSMSQFSFPKKPVETAHSSLKKEPKVSEAAKPVVKQEIVQQKPAKQTPDKQETSKTDTKSTVLEKPATNTKKQDPADAKASHTTLQNETISTNEQINNVNENIIQRDETVLENKPDIKVATDDKEVEKIEKKEIQNVTEAPIANQENLTISTMESTLSETDFSFDNSTTFDTTTPFVTNEAEFAFPSSNEADTATAFDFSTFSEPSNIAFDDFPTTTVDNSFAFDTVSDDSFQPFQFEEKSADDGFDVSSFEKGDDFDIPSSSRYDSDDDDDDEIGKYKYKGYDNSDSDDDDDKKYGGSHSSDDDEPVGFSSFTSTGEVEDFTSFTLNEEKLETFLVQRILSDPTGALLLEHISESTINLIDMLTSTEENQAKMKQIVLAGVTRKKQTLLHLAASAGCIEWIQFALSMGCPESGDENENTPLHIAAAKGHFVIVKALIDSGANIKAVNDESRTPLHLACASGSKPCVTILVNNKAGLEEKDKYGMIPLHVACLSANKQIIMYLLVFQANAIEVIDYNGRTPLHAAAHTANWPCCKILIEKGANVHSVDYQGRSMLMWVLSQSNTTTSGTSFSEEPIIQCLNEFIEAGCELDIVDKQERTCLHYASYYGLIGSLRFLLFQPSNIHCDARDINHQSALHAAAAGINGDDETSKQIVTLLLDNNVNVGLQSKKTRQTALHVAASLRKQQTVDVLLNAVISNQLNVFDFLDAKKRSLAQYFAENNLNDACLTVLNYAPELLEHVDANKWTLYHSITKGGAVDLLREIVSNQDITAAQNTICSVDRFGRNIFHIAAGLDRLEIINTLSHTLPKDVVERLLTTKDRRGNLPVHYAALRGKYYILEFILDNFPSQMNATTENGHTPLHTAIAGNGSIPCVRLLLENNSDVNCRDDNGAPPVFYTIKPKDSNLALLEVLISEYNADTTIVGDGGMSIVSLASDSEDAEKIFAILDQND